MALLMAFIMIATSGVLNFGSFLFANETDAADRAATQVVQNVDANEDADEDKTGEAAGEAASDESGETGDAESVTEPEGSGETAEASEPEENAEASEEVSEEAAENEEEAAEEEENALDAKKSNIKSSSSKVNTTADILEYSKSKSATELDENNESEITLSFPSMYENLATDIVFVLDKSSYSATKEPALELLSNLKEVAETTNANVKVAVIGFNRFAQKNTDGFKSLTDDYETIKDAFNSGASGGTNMHAGLLAAKELLDSDTEVPASRKYFVLVSDGDTYLYCPDGDYNKCYTRAYRPLSNAKAGAYGGWYDTSWYFASGRYGNLGAPNNYEVDGWDAYLNDVAKRNNESNGDQYDFEWKYYDDLWMLQAPTADEYIEQPKVPVSCSNRDMAMYYATKVYREMEDSGYTGFAKVADNTSSAGTPNFVRYLNGGSIIDFDEIEQVLTYAMYEGSYVEDYLGYEEGEYDFEFADPASTTVTYAGVNSDGEAETYDAVSLGDNKYGFGDDGNGGYMFEVTFYDGEKGEGHFVWKVNQDITNYDRVQLTYKVKLKDLAKDGKTHGAYDEDGSKGYDGAYTNTSATFYPADKDGNIQDGQDFARPTVQFTSEKADAPYNYSKSKTATNLDENYESEITLSFPSMADSLATDVVFVLDKSSYSETTGPALNLLKNLKEKAEAANANVKIGLIEFNRTGHSKGFMSLTDEYDDIEAAFQKANSGGTNIHAGLLAAKEMLDEDTEVPASRKYFVLVSDGDTYLYCPDGDYTKCYTRAYTAFEKAGTVAAYGGWYDVSSFEPNSKKGNVGAPNSPDVTAWDKYLADVEARNKESNGDQYDFEWLYYDEEWKKNPDLAEAKYIAQPKADRSASNRDMARYYAAKVYHEMEDAGYTGFAKVADNTSSAGTPNFIRYLNGGSSIEFDEIEQVLSYAMYAGSTIEDYLGYEEGSYEFEFSDPASTTIVYSGASTDGKAVTYKAESLGDGKYGFGKTDDGYMFEVTFYEGDAADRHFVWKVNQDITNYDRVQLKYTVKLTNPVEDGQVHGQYDADGSQGYDGLYTNTKATFYPVDKDGTEYKGQDFARPTVSYGEKKDDPGDDPDDDDDTPSDTPATTDDDDDDDDTPAVTPAPARGGGGGGPAIIGGGGMGAAPTGVAVTVNDDDGTVALAPAADLETPAGLLDDQHLCNIIPFLLMTIAMVVESFNNRNSKKHKEKMEDMLEE